MLVPKVIVIEDEADLRSSICLFLAASGFDVRGVDNGPQFDQAWAEAPADLLVLDINLPGEDGFSIAARMRRKSPVGIIMLTARSQAEDRVAGIESGADNYLTKPVNLRELAAVAKGLVRRLNHVDDQQQPAAWIFDVLNWCLIAPNGNSVCLTTAEYWLLERLCATPGAPIPSEEILAVLGKAPIDTNRRSLDSVLSRLRRKVQDECGISLPIRSVRSVGYVFAAPIRKI